MNPLENQFLWGLLRRENLTKKHLLCTDLCLFYKPFLPTSLENNIDVKSFIDVSVLNKLDEWVCQTIVITPMVLYVNILFLTLKMNEWTAIHLHKRRCSMFQPTKESIYTKGKGTKCFYTFIHVNHWQVVLTWIFKD